MVSDSIINGAATAWRIAAARHAQEAARPDHPLVQSQRAAKVAICEKQAERIEAAARLVDRKV